MLFETLLGAPSPSFLLYPSRKVGLSCSNKYPLESQGLKIANISFSHTPHVHHRMAGVLLSRLI